jgi:hypothetical protein
LFSAQPKAEPKGKKEEALPKPSTATVGAVSDIFGGGNFFYRIGTAGKKQTV